MSEHLILSIFPGIDGLGMGFEEEMPEACVVRGPDLITGGNIKGWHVPAGKFWGIVGGPPCKPFSRLRYLVEHNGYEIAENLIPEFERVVYEAQPEWFLMENVPSAPVPHVPDYQVHSFILNNRWLGESQNRERRFSFGTLDGRKLIIDVALFESPDWEPAVLASGGARPVPVAIGGNGKRKRTTARNLGYKTEEYFRRGCRLQGFGEDFDLPGFTVAGKIEAVGNAVPRKMARAIAKAVRRAMEAQP